MTLTNLLILGSIVACAICAGCAVRNALQAESAQLEDWPIVAYHREVTRLQAGQDQQGAALRDLISFNDQEHLEFRRRLEALESSAT